MQAGAVGLATDTEPEEGAVSTPQDRSTLGRLGAYSRWAHEDPKPALAKVRKGFDARFEDEVDPDRVLPPAERARRVEAARKAYFTKLALQSAKARRQRKAGP
jgi:hypothetical protein